MIECTGDARVQLYANANGTYTNERADCKVLVIELAVCSGIIAVKECECLF